MKTYNKEWHKEYYKKNKEKILKRNKIKYREKNPEVIKRNFTEDEFQNKLKQIHGEKYKTLELYVNINKKIITKCNKCSFEWPVKPSKLLEGSGCPKCALANRTHTNEYFIKRLKEKHGGKLISLSNFKNYNTKIKMLCNACKQSWETKPSHLIHSDSGCPNCNSSKGEKKIKEFLEKNKIIYETQYSFSECRDKQVLHFDFAIFGNNKKINILIEYDGIQHFKPVSYFGGEEYFFDIKRKDKIKNDFCKKNNIKLIRIPYTMYKKIDKKLSNEIL